jgi:queuosine precursor transporter
MIAFYGVYGYDILFSIIVSNYIFKCSIEILFTPFTYLLVNKLKKEENIDHYDKNTNFNPFSL